MSILNRGLRLPLLGFLISLAISLALLFFFHGKILTAPNDYLLSGSGDGFKNYATVLHHVKHGESSSHFTGMNYPFGEQVVFTDNQPVFANKLRIFNKIFPSIGDWTVGWINLSMFLGVAFAAAILCLLLMKLGLPLYYSVICSVFIAFLSPQLLRFAGHYALAHCWVLPALLYLLLIYYQTRRWYWGLAIAALTTLSSGLHMYFFALNSFFCALWLGFDFLRHPRVRRLLENGIQVLLMCVIPFALISIWMAMTDGITDRPSTPYGFLVYRSMPEGIFLPIGLPLGDWINDNVMKIRDVPWEGLAHVGLVAGISFLVLLAKIAGRIFTGKIMISVLPYHSGFLLNSILAALVLLLFSWGLPFTLGLEWLLPYTGPLQQFRGIGRFAWLFFYVVNILIAFSMYSFLKERSIVIQNALIVTFFVCIPFQIYQHNSRYLYAKNEDATFLQKDTFSNDHWSKVLDKEKHQAILPLPYFHIGSENFYLEPEGMPLKEVLSATVISGIPTNGVYMSRTSLEQTIENIQLMSEPYKDFSILRKMDKEKPFAIWHKEGSKLPAHQQKIISRSKKIWSKGKNSLYEIHPSTFKKLLEEKRFAVRKEFTDASVFEKDGIMSTDSLHRYFLERFEPQEFKMTTGRDFYRKIEMANKKPGTYLFSAWIKIDEDLAPRSEILIHETIDAKPIGFQDHQIGRRIVAIENGWGLVEMPLEVKEANSAFEITIFMNGFLKPHLTIKDLLIRPADVDVYWQDGKVLTKNLREYRLANERVTE